MKRTDASGHVSHLFSDGDPLTGTPGTVLDASFLNAVQEEIANVIEGAGDTLNAADDTQLYQAILTMIAASIVPSRPVMSMDNFLHVQDQKTAGTNGGTSSSTTEHTRTLNTVVTNNIAGASLASNQITLPGGTFFMLGSAPNYQGNSNRLKLRNITDAVNTLIGKAFFGASSYNSYQVPTIAGLFTIGAPKVFELRHYIQLGLSTNGLGVSVGDGSTEVYSEVMIWKVT